MQPAQFVIPGHLTDQEGQVSDSFSLTDCESTEVTHVSLNLAEKRDLAAVYADSVNNMKARLKQQSEDVLKPLNEHIDLLVKRTEDIKAKVSSVSWDQSIIRSLQMRRGPASTSIIHYY